MGKRRGVCGVVNGEVTITEQDDFGDIETTIKIRIVWYYFLDKSFEQHHIYTNTCASKYGEWKEVKPYDTQVSDKIGDLMYDATNWARFSQYKRAGYTTLSKSDMKLMFPLRGE